MANSNHTKNKTCPVCQSQTLSCQELPGGAVEQICLNPLCDYHKILVDPQAGLSGGAGSSGGYDNSLPKLGLDQLAEMARHLQETVSQLGGRQQRLAARQLKRVNAELARRKDSRTAGSGRRVGGDGYGQGQGQGQGDHESEQSTGMPPQLNTPAARTKRLRALRQYHQRLKQIKALAPMTDGKLGMSMQLRNVCQALRRDEHMHINMARQLAPKETLHAAHIEHLARASELGRVLEMLEDLAGDQVS